MQERQIWKTPERNPLYDDEYTKAVMHIRRCEDENPGSWKEALSECHWNPKFYLGLSHLALLDKECNQRFGGKA